MHLLLRPQDRQTPRTRRRRPPVPLPTEMLGGDLVAAWDVALSDGVHRIEFAHGTTTGKRVVTVDGQEVIRRDWMFKLVGRETFAVGGANTRAAVTIAAVGGFAYEYTLEVGGKSLQRFVDNRAKSTKTWLLKVDGDDYRVVLEKDTMDVWCNGQKMETTGEFVDDGTETCFAVGGHECCVKASSGGKRSGIVHFLLLDGERVPASAQ